MKTEVPLCRRCCFCIPLRYGLLVWGYLALLPIALLIISDSFDLYNISKLLEYYTVFEVIRFVVTLIAKVIAFALTLLLIIACHKKDTHLLKISYTYGLLSIGLNALLLVTATVIDMYYYLYWGYLTILWRFMLLQIVLMFIFIGVQLYIIAMLRSEILKLENSSKFEFRNMAAEAECTYYGPSEGRTNLDNPHDAQVTVYNEVTKNNNENNEQSSALDKEENNEGKAFNVGKTMMLNSSLSAIVNKNVGYGKVVNEE